MKSFLENKSGDIVRNKGDFVFVEGKDEVIQQIRTILKTNAGEWFRNDEYGIHNKNVLAKKINVDLVKDEIKNGLSQCSEEITIETIEIGYSKEHRLLYAEFRAYGSDGERYDTSVELGL